MWPFKSKRIITPEDKEWTEINLSWLKQQFGEHVDLIKLNNNILSSRSDETEKDTKQILNYVCNQMNVSVDNIELRFFSPPLPIDGISLVSDEEFPEGVYYQEGNDSHVIEINTQELRNLDSLIATIAHEVAHIKLLTLGDAEEDEEYLADLTAIYFGFGIYISNSSFYFNQWQDSLHQKWIIKRSGYLPVQIIVYAIILLYPNLAQSDCINYFTDDIKKQIKKAFKILNK